eukprot:g25767.t1
MPRKQRSQQQDGPGRKRQKKHAADTKPQQAQPAGKRYWLMKSEPDTHLVQGVDVSYSYQKLQKDGKGFYDGVRSHRAKKSLRDHVQVGDWVFFYHSSCKVPGVVGVAEVLEAALPDPKALDPKSPFYDPKHTPEAPIWYMCALSPVANQDSGFGRFVSLYEMKEDPVLRASDMVLFRVSRLSVQPVTPEQWARVMELSNQPEPENKGKSGKAQKAAASTSAKPSQAT